MTTGLKTKIFLNHTDIILEEDDLITPVEVDCLTFVRNKLQSNVTRFYHPVFGNPSFTKWPQKTKIACMHCCEGFSTVPVPAVRKYDEVKNIYFVYGIFCSLNCAKSYIIEHEGSISTIRLMYFNHMCRHVYNVKDAIRPAPPKIRLKKFGGTLTLKEFRLKSKMITTKIVKFPFVQTLTVCQEHSSISQTKSKESCTILPQSSTTTSSSAASLSGMYSNFLEKVQTTLPSTVKPFKSNLTVKKKKRGKVSKTKKRKKNGGLTAFVTFAR
jgi:hypothetical protein